ncbi:LPXTG cell wall anchor domain-containing protein [Bacillus wiedmannii]|uniref:LPXTG cell wall anchor domain-containing protein n=1 Tax=Bacillus wiedmannii TaxID=1890302 RepID=UPI00065BC1D6|nr:LPXTG cell wall anchor domain-containing protein [Bacillus wiedmannii]KMP73509.1 cell surface protein [Bacillus cereus]MCQ6542599.1 LPXTG cell wall anchor domain-containing protein [Bacillus wiedmannii]MCQ6573442.1 LPXTG cell wall anchor domain-containing protein [Bacillus wiedmannii]MCU5573656.1 LPXTG cell wall anchor domain-containing protein [Bacillus wiedmannii]WMS81611.1 LPXTG cell wall anchor domain-containing protein [Bacillus wiedmannii]
MKKKILPICTIILLSIGYSSLASASTGTMSKEEVSVQAQEQALEKKEAEFQAWQKEALEKKKAAMQGQEKKSLERAEAAIQEQQKEALEKKKAAIQSQQKNDVEKKEVAKQAVKGEKLPNTASNSITMMILSACLVAVGSVFGFTRRKIKA